MNTYCRKIYQIHPERDLDAVPNPKQRNGIIEWFTMVISFYINQFVLLPRKPGLKTPILNMIEN